MSRPPARPFFNSPPSHRRASERRAAFLFISPWLVGFAVFMLYPVVYTGYLSLTDYDVFSDPSFVGLDNYRELVSGRRSCSRCATRSCSR